MVDTSCSVTLTRPQSLIPDRMSLKWSPVVAHTKAPDSTQHTYELNELNELNERRVNSSRMWLEERRGNRGVCGKQGFDGHPVTPAGAGRVRTGNRAGPEDGSVGSIPEPESTEHHPIYAPPTTTKKGSSRAQSWHCGGHSGWGEGNCCSNLSLCVIMWWGRPMKTPSFWATTELQIWMLMQNSWEERDIQVSVNNISLMASLSLRWAGEH